MFSALFLHKIDSLPQNHVSENKFYMSACFLALMVMLCGGNVASPAQAQEKERPVRLYIVQQSLVSAFEALGNISGVGVQVDPSIDRVASTVNLQGSYPEVFAQLARHYNLFYWFDGSRYTIAPANSVSRWSISSNNIETSETEKAIRSVAPHIVSDAIRFDPDMRIVHVAGPRELRDAIEKALENATRWRQEPVSIIKFGNVTR